MRQHKEKKLFSIRTNFPTTKFFTENLLAIETKKTEILMNKSGYLGNQFSYYKVFHRKFISNRNEKNWNTYE